MPLPESTIDPHVIQAYRETNYHVHGPHPFILKIGTPCPELLPQYQASRTNCSLFITAYNPFSQQLDDTDNTPRHAALAATLAARDVVFTEGISQHPFNGWPAEPSFLAFGINLDEAKKLGRQFSQNAIVWIGADTIPYLILLR